MKVKYILIGILLLLLTVTLFGWSYVNVAGAYSWLQWSSDDYKPILAEGMVKDAYFSGGKRNCQCTIIKFETEQGVISIYSNLGKTNRDRIKRLGGTYGIKYYPSGNGENTAIEIKVEPQGTIFYSEEMYKGYGIALSSFVLGVFLLTMAFSLVYFGAKVFSNGNVEND